MAGARRRRGVCAAELSERGGVRVWQRWAGIGLQGAAGWFNKGRRDLGVRARIGRPARSPGRGSRLAVTRPGEAGETGLTRWGQPISERGDARGAGRRPGAWAAELRRGRGAESLSCGARLRSDAGGWDRAVGDAASARRERGSVRSKGLTGRSRAPGRCARAEEAGVWTRVSAG